MRCDDCRSYINQWLERQIHNTGGTQAPTAIDPDILTHTSQCPECAKILKTAGLIAGQESFDTACPEGLEDRVAQTVLDKIKQNDQHRRVAKWPVPYRYLLAAAALVLAFVPFMITRGMSEVGKSATAHVRLHIEEPQAKQVYVVGDWNNWDIQAQSLAKDSEAGIWSIEISLERGRDYQYQFVIDGEHWKSDPNAYLQVDDGFGGKNSVIEM